MAAQPTTALVAAPSAIGTTVAAATATPEPTGRLFFQNVVRDDGYAHISFADLDDPNGTRTIAGPICERVYVVQTGGLCLRSEFGLVTSYYADILDEELKPIGRVSLNGPPSRARISRDGRYGAATVFVFGHSYADVYFSTATTIIDMPSATIVANLEDFVVDRGGEVIKAPDFNFWGVTFAADANKFYATLRTGGKTYLVEGDIQARRMRTLAENVECPSLSPDGTMVAFKKFVGQGPTWRLHVLDLTTMAETALAEERSVDDQAEWLDNANVTYAVGEDIWTVPADGTGRASLLVAQALSPAVLR